MDRYENKAMERESLSVTERMPFTPSVFVQRFRELSVQYFEEFFCQKLPDSRFINSLDKTFYLCIPSPRRFQSEREQGTCLGMYRRIVKNIFLEGMPLGRTWQDMLSPKAGGGRDDRSLEFKSDLGDHIKVTLTSLDYYETSHRDPSIEVRMDLTGIRRP